MKTNIKVSILLLSIFFVASCQKENATQNELSSKLASIRSGLPSVVEILGLFDKPVDGYLAIKSSNTLFSQYDIDQDFPVILDAKLSNSSLLGESAEVIKIDKFPLNYNKESNQYGNLTGVLGTSNLYGTDVTIKGGANLNNFEATFYCPKPLRLNLKPLQEGNIVSDNMNITWNTDDKNTFGIGLLIEFDPKSSGNLINGIKGDKILRTLIHTEDDGSYVISEKDLSLFPKNSEVTIYMGRGNYKNVSVDSKNSKFLGVYSYTTVSHIFQVIK